MKRDAKRRLEAAQKAARGAGCPACRTQQGPWVWLATDNDPSPLGPDVCPDCGRRLVVVLDMSDPHL